MKRPKHLVVETEDAERRPNAAEHQRQVVQKQPVDTLTFRVLVEPPIFPGNYSSDSYMVPPSD